MIIKAAENSARRPVFFLWVEQDNLKPAGAYRCKMRRAPEAGAHGGQSAFEERSA
jgi:hypothetical protein